MAVSHYAELLVWQKSMDFVVACYRATEDFPKHEWYGLRSQLRRAAVSVPSNIAEGQGRAHTLEFLNFLSTAHGSLCEAETQILIADRLGYLPHSSAAHLLDLLGEIGRMMSGLRAAVGRRLPRPSEPRH